MLVAGLVLVGCDTTPTGPTLLTTSPDGMEAQHASDTGKTPTLAQSSDAGERAATIVAAAFELLERAELLAGDNPSQAIVDALERAAAHCAAARSALDAEDYRLAIEEASACSQIARWILASLSRDDRDETVLKERAQAAVAAAFELLERAELLAGDNPSQAIQDALERAAAHCAAARSALDAEDYRLAIEEASACSQIARWILGTGSRGESLAEQAAQAVAAAQALLAQVAEQIGPDPSPALTEFLIQTAILIGEANVALGDGDYAAALAMARQAISQLNRLSGPRGGR